MKHEYAIENLKSAMKATKDYMLERENDLVKWKGLVKDLELSIELSKERIAQYKEAIKELKGGK